MSAVPSPPSLYPVALDLRGKPCVVVGGGGVASRKVAALVEAGAAVTVVAPEVNGKIRELAAAGCVKVREEPFMPSHIHQAFLVIAATDSPAVNGAVADAARAGGALLNLAAPGDDSESGDFATMATVRRGELLIALTTGGAGPAVAARLRRELDAQFGPEWTPYVALLREMRVAAKVRYDDDTTRTAALRRLAASDDVRHLLRAGDTEGARREALICLS